VKEIVMEVKRGKGTFAGDEKTWSVGMSVR
jgi:hypothetical protein